MKTGISLKDGSYIDVRQIASVKSDKMDWCTVTLNSGVQFECQDYKRVMTALNEYNTTVDKKL